MKSELHSGLYVPLCNSNFPCIVYLTQYIYIFILCKLWCLITLNRAVEFDWFCWGARATHCVKSVQKRSYFWSVIFCIQSEYRKIRTRNNSQITIKNVNFFVLIVSCLCTIQRKKNYIEQLTVKYSVQWYHMNMFGINMFKGPEITPHLDTFHSVTECIEVKYPKPLIWSSIVRTKK